MTTAEPLPDALDPISDAVVEEVLAVGDDGDTVVLVIVDGGRSQVYQYRCSGLVVAEAPNLRTLADRIAIAVEQTHGPDRYLGATAV